MCLTQVLWHWQSPYSAFWGKVPALKLNSCRQWEAAVLWEEDTAKAEGSGKQALLVDLVTLLPFFSGLRIETAQSREPWAKLGEEKPFMLSSSKASEPNVLFQPND